GNGPMLVATDLQDCSVAAGRFGLQLARDFQRDLVCLHASPSNPPDGRDGADPERWIERIGLGGATVALEPGDPVAAMLTAARARDAAVLVCGSRHLTLGQRVFIASTGTDLARDSRRPVLIVPPESINRAPG
ncbi:MAG: universal stress protein, partial [Myxococcota bacterium]